MLIIEIPTWFRIGYPPYISPPIRQRLSAPIGCQHRALQVNDYGDDRSTAESGEHRQDGQRKNVARQECPNHRVQQLDDSEHGDVNDCYG